MPDPKKDIIFDPTEWRVMYNFIAYQNDIATHVRKLNNKEYTREDYNAAIKKTKEQFPIIDNMSFGNARKYAREMQDYNWIKANESDDKIQFLQNLLPGTFGKNSMSFYVDDWNNITNEQIKEAQMTQGVFYHNANNYSGAYSTESSSDPIRMYHTDKAVKELMRKVDNTNLSLFVDNKKINTQQEFWEFLKFIYKDDINTKRLLNEIEKNYDEHLEMFRPVKQFEMLINLRDETNEQTVPTEGYYTDITSLGNPPEHDVPADATVTLTPSFFHQTNFDKQEKENPNRINVYHNEDLKQSMYLLSDYYADGLNSYDRFSNKYDKKALYEFKMNFGKKYGLDPEDLVHFINYTGNKKNLTEEQKAVFPSLLKAYKNQTKIQGVTPIVNIYDTGEHHFLKDTLFDKIFGVKQDSYKVDLNELDPHGLGDKYSSFETYATAIPPPFGTIATLWGDHQQQKKYEIPPMIKNHRDGLFTSVKEMFFKTYPDASDTDFETYYENTFGGKTDLDPNYNFYEARDKNKFENSFGDGWNDIGKFLSKGVLEYDFPGYALVGKLGYGMLDWLGNTAYGIGTNQWEPLDNFMRIPSGDHAADLAWETAYILPVGRLAKIPNLLRTGLNTLGSRGKYVLGQVPKGGFHPKNWHFDKWVPQPNSNISHFKPGLFTNIKGSFNELNFFDKLNKIEKTNPGMISLNTNLGVIPGGLFGPSGKFYSIVPNSTAELTRHGFHVPSHTLTTPLGNSTFRGLNIANKGSVPNLMLGPGSSSINFPFNQSGFLNPLGVVPSHLLYNAHRMSPLSTDVNQQTEETDVNLQTEEKKYIEELKSKKANGGELINLGWGLNKKNN